MKLKYLLEEFKDYVKGPLGNKDPLFINPSKKELDDIDKNNTEKNKNFFRVILDLKNKNAYFSTGSIFHHEMVRVLKIPSNFDIYHKPVISEDVIYLSCIRRENKMIPNTLSSLTKLIDTFKLDKKEAIVGYNNLKKLIINTENNKAFISTYVDYDILINYLNKSEREMARKHPYLSEQLPAITKNEQEK